MEHRIGEEYGYRHFGDIVDTDVPPEVAIHPPQPEYRCCDQDLKGQSTKPWLKVSGRHLPKVEVEAHQQRKPARHNDQNGIQQDEQQRLDGYAFLNRFHATLP